MPVEMRNVLVGGVAVVETVAGAARGRIQPVHYGGVSGNFFDDEAKKAYYWPESGVLKALRMPKPMASFLILRGVAQEVLVTGTAGSRTVGTIWYDTSTTGFAIYRTPLQLTTLTERFGVPARATAFPNVVSVTTQK